jgi:putative spermidine/putrescine transport system ATP-binding protein
VAGHLVLPGGRLAVGDVSDIASAVAMVRPETIHLVDPGSASLSGIVDSVSFIGGRQRIVVSGASNKLVSVDAANTVKAHVGESVGLSIAPEDVRLLPTEN